MYFFQMEEQGTVRERKQMANQASRIGYFQVRVVCLVCWKLSRGHDARAYVQVHVRVTTRIVLHKHVRVRRFPFVVVLHCQGFRRWISDKLDEGNNGHLFFELSLIHI